VRRIICDRCESVIVDKVLALKIEAGRLRRRSTAVMIDLCDPCNELFGAFLASGKPADAPQSPAATEGFDF
jgi:hypothetical protein